MKIHPAALMLMVWSICIAAFYVLPFQLQDRTMSLLGFAILAAFIVAFCGGSLLAGRPRHFKRAPIPMKIDFKLADRALMAGSTIALLALLLDVQGRDLLDLADAFQQRSDRAGALLAGQDSDSTIWFQIGFLTYPAGFIYMVRELTFQRKVRLGRLAVFGLGPIALVSLAMGGRAPLLYGLIVMAYAYSIRKYVLGDENGVISGRNKQRRKDRGVGATVKIAGGIAGAAAVIYFVTVFLARADVVGGADGMFDIASLSWGVNFNGTFSNIFFGLFGSEGTYLIFVFAWYAVQGFVMSNYLFTNYDGPMLFGTYGIDLVSALMRRVNGDFVADRFYVLLKMNTYGFLPSAFGSLFVDLKFLGILVCLGWGWIAGRIYKHVREGIDKRWLLAVPFVNLGIVFSVINTPIGFSNGLTTHAWLVLAMVLTKARRPAVRHRPDLSQAVQDPVTP